MIFNNNSDKSIIWKVNINATITSIINTESMNRFLENTDANNVYARNVEERIIHVSEANSGRKGYYC